MPNRANLRWTDEDETALRQLAEKGFYLRKLALRLQRTPASIMKRARVLNIEVKPTPRCGFKFDDRAAPTRPLSAYREMQ